MTGTWGGRGSVVRVGGPITRRLAVRFTQKIGETGVSVHLFATAEVPLSKALYPHAPWALWMAAHRCSVWYLWSEWPCACVCSTGANLDGLKKADKFCDNKSDLNLNEFKPLTRTQQDYWKYSIICLTTTWLQEHIPNSKASLTSFQTTGIQMAYRTARVKEEGLQCLLAADGIVLVMLLRGSVSAPCTNCWLWVFSLLFYWVGSAILLINATCGVTSSVVSRLQTQQPKAFMARFQLCRSHYI